MHYGRHLFISECGNIAKAPSMVLLKDDTSCLLDVDVETCKNTN